MGLKSKKMIDLSGMTLEELRALVARAERQLAIRRFEEEMKRAVSEFQTRDNRVIRL